MYFSLLPDIKYDTKPTSYPFSESDFITTKNFFRRYRIDDDVFGYATFYNKYAVGDGERIENIADAYYGSPFYDWVIILTNNCVKISKSPDILFIAIDDMNDWTTLFDNKNPIQTPNLKRLANRGAFFSKAYSVVPSFNPSRTAILT